MDGIISEQFVFCAGGFLTPRSYAPSSCGVASTTLQAYRRFRITCEDAASCHIWSNGKFDVHQELNRVDHTIRPSLFSQKRENHDACLLVDSNLEFR
jgi:hypothetical protein